MARLVRYAVGLCVAGYGALQVLGRQAGSTWQEGPTRFVRYADGASAPGTDGQVLVSVLRRRVRGVARVHG
jgi:hypothetical protein